MTTCHVSDTMLGPRYEVMSKMTTHPTLIKITSHLCILYYVVSPCSLLHIRLYEGWAQGPEVPSELTANNL